MSWTRNFQHRFVLRFGVWRHALLSNFTFQLSITTICRIHEPTVYEMNKNTKCFYLLKTQVHVSMISNFLSRRLRSCVVAMQSTLSMRSLEVVLD
jgi:hypothetical protein